MVFLILIPALKVLPGEILDCRHRHCAHACFNFLICASIYRQKYITISVEKDTIFGAVFSGLAGVIALTTLSVLHDKHDIHIIHQQEDSEKQTARAIKLAAKGVPPQGGMSIFLNDPVFRGEKIFKESCNGCHMVKGEGGETGADFTNFGSREWVSELLKDPKSMKYFKESGTMPPVKLPDESLLDMAEFLLSQSGGLINQNTDRLERGKNWF